MNDWTAQCLLQLHQCSIRMAAVFAKGEVQTTSLRNSRKLYSLFVDKCKWYIFNSEQPSSWFDISSSISTKYLTKFLERYLNEWGSGQFWMKKEVYSVKPNQSFSSQAIQKLQNYHFLQTVETALLRFYSFSELLLSPYDVDVKHFQTFEIHWIKKNKITYDLILPAGEVLPAIR